jgi:hypothetical protein
MVIPFDGLAQAICFCLYVEHRKNDLWVFEQHSTLLPQNETLQQYVNLRKRQYPKLRSASNQ